MKTILIRLLGVLLFVYLVFGYAGIDRIQTTLSQTNPLYLLGVVPFHLLLWLLRSMRWRVLLRNEQINLPLLDILAVSASGYLIGVPTPGRLGEFAKIKFLMNAGFPFRGSFMSSLIERLFDVAALGLFGGMGLLVCFTLLPENTVVYLFYALAILAGLFIIYMNRRWVYRKIITLIPENLAAGVDNKMHLFFESFFRLNTSQWFWLSIYSLGIWGINFWILYLLFTGTGLSISMHYAFAFAAFGWLAGMAPITIYGMGVREAIFLFFFPRIGYGPEEAATAAVIFGLMYLVLMLYHIVLGFVCWMSPVMGKYLQLRNLVGVVFWVSNSE